MTLTEGRLLKREGDMLPGSDPVRPPDNSDMSSAARATNQLCIISRDPLRAFIAALSPALRGCEELTIIVDRRQAENVAAAPAIERRQHPAVDARVKTDGFALVPLSTKDNPKNPLWIERTIDHQSAGDDAQADERELQRIFEFKRRPKVRIRRLVRVSAIVGTLSVLIVLFVQMPAGRALVNRARLVASPTSERPPEPSIELHSLSVVEAPAPPRPVRLPAQLSGRPRDTGRARTEVASLPPNHRSESSLQPERQPTSPEPAAPARPASVPTLPSDVTPPARPHPMIATSPEPTSPGEVTASPSSAPRQPSAGTLEAWKQALASRVTRDVDAAGADAKRQIDELKSNTMRNLDEMRRVWHRATRAFSDTAADQVQRETAARKTSAGEQ